MTEQADLVRDRRRRFAAPGGFHDKLIRALAVALPAAIGVLAALMVLSPLSPRGEISFLLDRNRVAVVDDRLRVESAMYRGKDNVGRPFSITAGGAVQHSARVPVVTMNALVARILLAQGPAVLTAQTGNYDMSAEQVRVFGPVVFAAADGYRMTAEDVDIDLSSRRMVSRGRVEGRVPAGTFRADRIIADLDGRTVTLDGNARLRMEPGKMRMP
ncbi:MAG: LPS export ABC transporter periplasmic protein LptC [Novosphingobium sp.]